MFEKLARRNFVFFEKLGCRTIGEFVDYIDDFPLSNSESILDFIRKCNIADITNENVRFLFVALSKIFKIYYQYEKIVKLYFSYFIVTTKVIEDEEYYIENLKESFINYISFGKQYTLTRSFENLISDIFMITPEERDDVGNCLKEYMVGKRLREIMSKFDEKYASITCPLFFLKEIGYGTDCFITVSTPGEASKEYPCHRLVMASFSDFFKTQFENEEQFRSEGGNRFSIEVSEHEFGVMDFFLSIPYYGFHYHPFKMCRSELFDVFGGKTDDELAILFGLFDRFSVISRVSDLMYKYISYLKISSQLYVLSALPFSKERIAKLASYSELSREEFLTNIEDADLDEQMSAIACQFSINLSKTKKAEKSKIPEEEPIKSAPTPRISTYCSPVQSRNETIESVMTSALTNPDMLNGIVGMMQNPAILQSLGPLISGFGPPSNPPMENAIPVRPLRRHNIPTSGENPQEVDAILEEALNYSSDENC